MLSSTPPPHPLYLEKVILSIRLSKSLPRCHIHLPNKASYIMPMSPCSKVLQNIFLWTRWYCFFFFFSPSHARESLFTAVLSFQLPLLGTKKVTWSNPEWVDVAALTEGDSTSKRHVLGSPHWLSVLNLSTKWSYNALELHLYITELIMYGLHLHPLIGAILLVLIIWFLEKLIFDLENSNSLFKHLKTTMKFLQCCHLWIVGEWPQHCFSHNKNPKGGVCYFV